MGKSPLGLFAGRVLKAKKSHARWAEKYYKRRMLMLDKKANPLTLLYASASGFS
jgi:small subunit ribosomal protein S12